jgi:hypothetical protein
VPLSEGAHRVKLRGLIAGLGSLETSEIAIELRCPVAPIRDAGTTLDAGADASVRTVNDHDARVVVTSFDAGSDPKQIDASNVAPRVPAGDDGCALAGNTGTMSWAWGALLLLVRKRRRVL